MDVSNSTAATAVKTLLSDKNADTTANGNDFGQVMSDLLSNVSEKHPYSDPIAPKIASDAATETRTTIGVSADIAKSDASETRTMIGVPADIAKFGAGRMTIADTSPFNTASETRTTIGVSADIAKSDASETRTTIGVPADIAKSGASETRTMIGVPADIAKSGAGRTTIADTSVFDLPSTDTPSKDAATALERSLSLLLANQFEAATTRFNGFDPLRTSDSG